MAGVIPWTWSMLESYETCPKQFYEEKIAKSVPPDTDSTYLVWGNEVHKAFELTIGQGVPFPERMKQWEHIAYRCRDMEGDKYVENKLAVNSQLQTCGFWDKDAWNRGLDDFIVIKGSKALTIDWKTGKTKQASGQLETSAARIMAKFSEVKEVHTAFAWLPAGTWTRATFVRDNYNQIWESYYPRIEKMLWSIQHNIWPAKPSGLCSKSKKPGSTYMGCRVTNCPHSENYKK